MRWLQLGLHLLGAVGGGYALAALSVAATGAFLARLGMARSEAVVLAAMLGLVAYLIWLIWSFAAPGGRRLARGLVGGAAAMAGLWWLVG